MRHGINGKGGKEEMVAMVDDTLIRTTCFKDTSANCMHAHIQSWSIHKGLCTCVPYTWPQTDSSYTLQRHWMHHSLQASTFSMFDSLLAFVNLPQLNLFKFSCKLIQHCCFDFLACYIY